jgi:hypothetical protein
VNYKIFGDIPLAKAMLTWNSVHHLGPTHPLGVAVVPHPEPYACRKWNLQCSSMAAYAYWKDLPTDQQLLRLYIEVWHIVCRDLVPAELVHDALLVIPEYRETLSGEQFFWGASK